MKKASAKDISDAINKIFQEKNQELLKKIEIHENKLLKKVSPNEISELFRECFNENNRDLLTKMQKLEIKIELLKRENSQQKRNMM